MDWLVEKEAEVANGGGRDDGCDDDDENDDDNDGDNDGDKNTEYGSNSVESSISGCERSSGEKVILISSTAPLASVIDFEVA